MTRLVYWPVADHVDDLVRITDEEHRHLHVTRIETGEVLELFDGRGKVWQVRVREMRKRETLAEVLETRDVAPPQFDVIAGIGLIRPQAMDEAIGKAVEVGVTRIVPLITDRSNSPLRERSDRWDRIVVESAKQSRHYHLPVVEPPQRFRDAVQRPAATKILFAEHGGASLKSALRGGPAVFLLGPEGGWTPAEVKLAEDSGCVPVWLGPHVLRTETAVAVGGALILYELFQTSHPHPSPLPS